ncbi:MAG: NnrS family protein [Rhodocyclales bacterium]|nr:NnrS family protein [Rhodocyclales bacterium]
MGAAALNFRASFFAAPHRVMFLGGAVQALLAMAFWSLQIGGHYAGLWSLPVWPLLTQIPMTTWHALLMGSGVFPWFVFGFILTAGPRWQGAGDLRQTEFLPPFLFLAGGWMLVWLALALPVLLGFGLTLAAIGWALVARILTRIALIPALGREHIRYVALAAWLGVVALACYGLLAINGDALWGRLGTTLTLWGFLLPVFATVAHRMLPFFTSAAIRGYEVHRPAWALRVLVAAGLGHGLLSLFDFARWLWPADLAALVASGHLSRIWWHRAIGANRMVLVLHLAFAWVPVAFALFALQGLLEPGALGQAPLHALAIGFFSSMLIGMVSRVTLGHSGRPVAADASIWASFCMMQLAAVLRVLGELPLPGPGAILLWLSAMAWLLGFGVWALAYAPALWRARADGKPG